jgi:hypothetical protein
MIFPLLIFAQMIANNIHRFRDFSTLPGHSARPGMSMRIFLARIAFFTVKGNCFSPEADVFYSKMMFHTFF